ncbi:hypothetical protein ABID99_001251 [Mucilaginibacter sp. OAE612]|uniref:hypothetical protein n=1 Tax=Mucilaginibacter sp. OAE612 TaxID=3156444 RepID=UPI00359E51DA
MFKRYLEYIGFTENEYPYHKEQYKPATTTDAARLYLDYLDKLAKAHAERTQTIETKVSQIIGQSSTVISITSLFISLFAERFSGLNLYVSTFLLILFIILFLHFILAIHYAIKLHLINKSRYMYGSTSTVTSEKRASTLLKFMNGEIDDSVKMINFNANATNKMASNLVYASRCFRLGIWFLAVLTISVLLSIAVVKKSSPSITISNIKDLNEKSVRDLQIKTDTEVKQLKMQVDSLRGQLKKAMEKKEQLLQKH